MLQVVAAALLDADGRVLLAQRPPGKALAGAWEFPGGKLEPGETPLAALARELDEELGIVPLDAEPLIRVPWLAGHRPLRLDAWQVRRWRGEPVAREGQALRWQPPAAVDPAELAPADRPLLHALCLPAHYAITPPDVPLDQAERLAARILAVLDAGSLVLLRLPHWPTAAVRALAARVRRTRPQAALLLHSDLEGARDLGLGVHLTAAQLRSLDSRPLPWQRLVGASCHDAHELARAAAIADFATLSPVAPTASHPGQPPLGWQRFAAAAEAAALPVYALGGLQPTDTHLARRHGAQGVAGIRAFWPDA
ncbi:MAG: Nudix family hydrolase [Fulvimonas sp.]|nr:Nudix family hydrolase [Fulvimonas sp.]